LLFQDNNLGAADTLLIHQAVLASQQNQPDAQMVYFSPDKYFLMLVVANYDLMLIEKHVNFSGLWG